ncbi:permease [Streptomyces sp. NBC_01239]|uniref:permease n=1 Tax=Streptomyces sp. NBC_01239 TaxID=2903792 RepID=UPI00225A7EF3|nr:permease [Streptomyces sp. NBC_01239]MCX4812022.1 permease [Streptomyces sp. NBC_01239]
MAITTEPAAPTTETPPDPQTEPETKPGTKPQTKPAAPAKESPGADPAKASKDGWQLNSPLVLTMVLLLVVLAQGPIRQALSVPVMQSWMTVFVAVVVQALPFLVLGVLLSAGIAVFVPATFFARALPKNPVLAVPIAGMAGAILPGCECASVPVAGALVRRGVTPAAAIAFLLSAPAINPIVLTATAVAFPRNPEMVLARFVGSLLVACVMGWLWTRLGRTDWLRLPAHEPHEGETKGAAFWGSVRHDVMQAGGFLVLGAMSAATLKAVAPASWLRTAADNPVVAILALSILAVLLSICSEADAFVAASLTQFSLTAKLAFLVVGPMIDLKLFAMQAGTFGRGFALRFAPATFVLAITGAVVTGAVLL